MDPQQPPAPPGAPPAANATPPPTGGDSAAPPAAGPGKEVVTATPPGAPAPNPTAEAPAPAIPQDAPTLAEKIAQLWREQADIIAARIFMDTQALFGVGAVPPDIVINRTIVLNLANALERGDQASFLFTFARNAREVSEQINDQTIPYLPGVQLGGHIEGVLRDTISRGFRADAALAEQALALLDEWFSPAYPALLGEPRALVQWQAPRI